MFNTLQRYIFSTFLKNFLGVIVLCVGIFIIAQLIDNLKSFLGATNVPLSAFIMFFVYDIPFTFTYIYPMSVMFGVVYTLGRLNSQNELIIMYNTGVSIYKLILPIIIFVFILSTIFVVFDKEIFYENHRKAREMSMGIKKRFNKRFGMVKRDVATFGSEKKIYFIKRYIPVIRLMDYAHILYLDQDFIFKKLISARRLQYNTNLKVWQATNVLIRSWTGSNENIIRCSSTNLVLGETPDFFLGHEKKDEYMSSSEAKKVAEKLKTSGGNWEKYMTAFYFKLGTPFAAIVIIFLSIPLALFSRRINVVISLFIVLVTVFTFMVFSWIGQSLGNNQILPPIIAGFFGHFIFSVVSYIFWKKVIL